MHPVSSPAQRRVLVLGATGTIGSATVRALLQRGHAATCLVRRPLGVGGARDEATAAAAAAIHAKLPANADVRICDVTDAAALAADGIRGERFDVLLSCMASRTGVPHDAWAIDHAAHVTALQAARAAGVTQVVLLSALCVQKPRLAFQHAKLAFEKVLIESGVDWSIVRPTAFFKSLSGQFERVRRGKPFLVFGDGTLTACKPISDDDLAAYLAKCLEDPALRNRVLPIGGPGPAITPRLQAEQLSAVLGKPVRIRSVPVALLDTIVAALGGAARVWPALAVKAELARIGRYYATESMLVLDAASGRYDAAATPSTGSQTLLDHYARLAAGERQPERGDHAVF